MQTQVASKQQAQRAAAQQTPAHMQDQAYTQAYAQAQARSAMTGTNTAAAKSAQAHTTSLFQLELRDRRCARIYTAVAIFLVLFSAIYLSLSHGVSSIWMRYLALIPLVLGTLPYTLMTRTHKHIFSRFSFNVYNSLVAALVVWSCITGILEIAAATSTKLVLLPLLSLVLFCAWGFSMIYRAVAD